MEEQCNHINCNCRNKNEIQDLSLLDKKSQEQSLQKFETEKELLGKEVKALESTLHKPFAHLHLHTDFSLLDGTSNVEEYIKLAKKYNHNSMAITDHGNMSGTFKFYKKCKEAGIKPIIGMEAYLNDKQGKFEVKKDEGSNCHQSIFIMNKEGYVNLNRLAYLSYTEGFYRRGRITTEWLLAHKKGLFITTSCLASNISKLIQEGKSHEAEEYLKILIKEFGDNLAVEFQLNEIAIQKDYNSFLIGMVKKHGLMPILTNDVHYALPEDCNLQDTLIAINQKSVLGKAFSLDARHLYYTNSRDFHNFNRKFGYNYPEKFIDVCLENTLKVVDKCNFEFETGVEKYPRYEPTREVINYFHTESTREIITKLAVAKLRQKLNIYRKKGILELTDEKVKEYTDRLNYEIQVIDDKKALDYFLVNWEIIQFCQKNSVITGPGRGSAAGCLLSWCLDITKIDPIRFGLYFERFLNPTRNSMPDIDIDFEMGSDEKLDNFLYEKYGKDRVLHVSTFSTFNEKGCLKDVVRAHHGQDSTGFDSVVFKVTQEMPNFNKVDYNLATWFKEWPDNIACSDVVRKWLRDSSNKIIIEQTLKLQGQIRGVGQHAAGVVITPTVSWEHIPTNIIATNKSIVTAFQEADGSGKDLSELGILKLDRLKLETLNVIKEAIKIIKEQKEKDIQDDIDYVDINDKNLFTELRLGLNHGIFQFESAGMNGLIRGIAIESFDELVAANALYRPGPMGIGAHEEYIKNKFHPDKISYVHNALMPILKDTNGVLIFQEQIMFIANKIGGVTLGDGDSLRRYMDKGSSAIAKQIKGETLTSKEQKDYADFKKYWDKFLDGAANIGYKKEEVDKIKEWVIKYLGYSFNKSHSLSYSYLAMQTLFLKHYYPTEFYTALLNHPKSNGDKEKVKQWLAAAIASAISKGIKILAPSRKSGWTWTMTGDKEISMGFSGIAGMGDVAYNELMTLLKGQNKTLVEITPSEFFSLPFSKFNKSAFGGCVKAGVFDDWSNSREYLLELKSKKRKKVAANQVSMFSASEFDIPKELGKNIKYPATTEAKRKIEFTEVCNFDIDKIERVANIKNKLAIDAKRQIDSIVNFSENDWYFFIIEDFKNLVTEKGKAYINMRVGDGISTTSLRIFEPLSNEWGPQLERGSVYVSQFIKNDKGFINFQRKAKLKKIA